MGIFSRNYKDPLTNSVGDPAARLKRRFNTFLDKYGNYYILRSFTKEKADDIDKLTEESPTGNNYKYKDVLLKSFTNHQSDTDFLNVPLDAGVSDANSVIFYVKPTIIPSVKDLIIETNYEGPVTEIVTIAEKEISHIFEITHVVEYKISNYLIYYAVYTKEKR